MCYGLLETVEMRVFRASLRKTAVSKNESSSFLLELFRLLER
jgi:hypothetical protein